MLRERCEQIESPAVPGGCHLGPVFLEKSEPLTWGRSLVRRLHGFEAGRKVGKPHVIPVLSCKGGLGHTSRRTADCANSSSFAFDSLAAEPDNAYDHWNLPGHVPNIAIDRRETAERSNAVEGPRRIVCSVSRLRTHTTRPILMPCDVRAYA